MAESADMPSFRPPNLNISVEEIEKLLGKLVKTCNGKSTKTLHYSYLEMFGPSLGYIPLPGKKPPLGATANQHKTMILQDLLFSQKAQERRASDTPFDLLCTWADHAVAVAKIITKGLRSCLADRIKEAERLLANLPAPASAGEEQTAKRARSNPSIFSPEEHIAALESINAFLDSEFEEHGWKALESHDKLELSEFHGQSKSIPVLKLCSAEETQSYKHGIEVHMLEMLQLESRGAICLDGPLEGLVQGLFFLTKIQSCLDGSLDAHGVDFWVLQIFQTSLARNASDRVVDRCVNLDLGLSYSQKETRSAPYALYGDIIRGLHHNVGQKVCYLVNLAIRKPLISRYAKLRNPQKTQYLQSVCSDFMTRFPERPSERAVDHQERYGVNRHGVWDANTRSRGSSRPSKLHARLNSLDVWSNLTPKMRRWTENITCDGRRSVLDWRGVLWNSSIVSTPFARWSTTNS